MSVNYSGFIDLKNSLESIQKNKKQIMEVCANDIAARLLRLVKQKTPVGKNTTVEMLQWRKTKNGVKVAKNKDGTAKTKAVVTRQGGQLRRGWTASKPKIGGNGVVIIEVSNNVYYATYVENGHRQTVGRYVPAIGKRLKRGWIPGKHMLKLSTEEIEKNAQQIVEAKIQKWLNEVMS